MDSNKLLVLIINDMVIFPNNEVRLEYDNTYDRQMVEIVEKITGDYMLLVNPIDDNADIDITSLPNYGVLGRLKLKINVPNGKTRIVIEGLRRVELSNYISEEKHFRANCKEVEIPTSAEDENYTNVLIKALERYIDKVPYMGNAIMGQLANINNLSDLCDLIASFLTIDYKRKKKYITMINPIESG